MRTTPTIYLDSPEPARVLPSWEKLLQVAPGLLRYEVEAGQAGDTMRVCIARLTAAYDAAYRRLQRGRKL